MRNPGVRTSLHMQSAVGLVLIAMLAACGSESSNGQTVAVNLSLVVNSQQAQNQSTSSRLMAFFQRWFPDANSVWAQSVSEISTINVQISGPDIPVPPTATVPVSNPTSGQDIPVSIQAPTGSNRTITVAALDGAGTKIFGGTLPNVTLAPGPPIALVITLNPVITITINKQGNGSGTVTSTPAGINCGATCSAQFDQGAQVSLTATAASGSSFAGWNGACSGTGACTVNSNATVTARFILAATNHLHVDKAGTGSGAVTSQPSGISCGTICDADFESGAIVTLTAAPADGSTFTSWSGAGCSGAVPSCIVVMNADQTVTATFTAIVPIPMSTLTVQKSGSGSGAVTSAPTGINCTNNQNTCTASFPTGNTVTLTASPANGSTFVAWSGACSGTTCTVTMSTDQTVSAQFDLVPDLVTLTANKQGNGDGTVTSDPAGISCGPGCNTSQASYLRGTTVTVTATPDGNSSFNDWHGGPCDNSSSLTCQLGMNDNETVSAHFVRN